MLGKGGMGEVWEGEHQLTGRRVAVKVLSDAYLQNKKVVARFGREARAASSVQHDGIVEILDQDRTEEGVPFLVMEFLEGESVGQRIKRQKRLSENEALAIMLPLLDALDAAHQAGVIHRDLKPDNVFILPGVRGAERIKILDFGISQKADEIEHRLTQEGSVLGTPHYMSPEQARGAATIDVRVDVYAAAVMFYECVVGEVPFDAGNYNALLQIILTEKPTPPRERGATLSAPVEQVLMAALSKRREDRPPNARAFRELLLEAGLQHEDVQLETQTWKFRSVPTLSSLPPRPASLAPIPAPPREVFELEADVFKPARTTGSFTLPGSSRRIEPKWGSGSITSLTPAAPLPVGSQASGPPLRSLLGSQASGPPAQNLLSSQASGPPAHDVFGARALETDAHGQRPPAPSAALELDVGQPRKPTTTRGMAVSQRGRSSGAIRVRKAKRGWFGALVGWLLMLGAIVALGYVASAVFKRPDPRKHRKPAEVLAPEPAPSP
ncbi:MAG: Serine/threonine protein kinase PrkC, regulator of stationary phase [Myxococcaceae bacterium]|nr:Serine/threonine protein kinase PrkC, regulator of stationary phase [Myxococcaceae bacterium]